MSRPRPGNRPRPGPSAPAHQVSALPGPEPVSPGLLALGYAVYAIAGVLSSIYEVLLVPTRWGGSLVPLAPALAVLSNIGLPLSCFRLSRTRLSAAPPVIGWVLSTVVLATGRPEGDVLLPAGATAWVAYSMLLGGLLAGLITVSLAGRAMPIRTLNRQWVRGGSGSGDAR